MEERLHRAVIDIFLANREARQFWKQTVASAVLSGLLAAALSRNLSIKDDARYNIPVQRVFKGKPSRLDLIFQRFDAPVYFITFNTRASLLATPRVHAVFIEYGLSAGDFRIGVGRYVLMPDHIHLFV